MYQSYISKLKTIFNFENIYWYLVYKRFNIIYSTDIHNFIITKRLIDALIFKISFDEGADICWSYLKIVYTVYSWQFLKTISKEYFYPFKSYSEINKINYTEMEHFQRMVQPKDFQFLSRQIGMLQSSIQRQSNQLHKSH